MKGLNELLKRINNALPSDKQYCYYISDDGKVEIEVTQDDGYKHSVIWGISLSEAFYFLSGMLEPLDEH